MEESSSHQPTIGPHQGNDSPHQAESGDSQRNNSVVNLQQKGDHEGSVQTTHTNRSQSRGKSHVSHAKNERDMQREIDKLKKKLRREGTHRLGLSLLLRIQKTPHTSNDPELHPAKLSRVTRNIVVIGVRIRVHRIRVLETKP